MLGKVNIMKVLASFAIAASLWAAVIGFIVASAAYPWVLLVTYVIALFAGTVALVRLAILD